MIRRGDFVLCNFPFREAGGPGPSPHIVLCAAAGGTPTRGYAIVFYTTSQTEYLGARRPRQYVFVDEDRAKKLRQRRAFHIDASRVARLPLTVEYFPELKGVVLPTIGRDAELLGRVEERMRALIAAGLQITRVDRVSPKRGR
jgi:hypothetical protein